MAVFFLDVFPLFCASVRLDTTGSLLTVIYVCMFSNIISPLQTLPNSLLRPSVLKAIEGFAEIHIFS